MTYFPFFTIKKGGVLGVTSGNYLYHLPPWHVARLFDEEKTPRGNCGTMIGFQKVAQFTLQWVNAFCMHNKLPALGFTVAVLMKNCSSHIAIGIRIDQ